jgi:hypothetical protein
MIDAHRQGVAVDQDLKSLVRVVLVEKLVPRDASLQPAHLGDHFFYGFLDLDVAGLATLMKVNSMESIERVFR